MFKRSNIFDAVKAATLITLSVGTLTACRGGENQPKATIPENPALCSTKAPSVDKLRDAIQQTRFLDFRSPKTLEESITTAKLTVLSQKQTEEIYRGTSTTMKRSTVELPGGVTVQNFENWNEAGKPTGSIFSAFHANYADSLLLRYKNEGIRVNFQGNIEPNTPENRKIVIEKGVNGVPTEVAYCSETADNSTKK
jgi:hypothetical protein